MNAEYVKSYVRLASGEVFRHRKMKGDHAFHEVTPDEYEVRMLVKGKGWMKVAEVHDADLDVGIIFLAVENQAQLLELELDDITIVGATIPKPDTEKKG
mgnify:CR=1 FL=1